MSDEVKPCPFCGVDAVLRNVEMVGCCYVACPSCETNGPDGSKPRAVTAWNTRAPVRVKPLEWDSPSKENNHIYCAKSPFGEYGIHICGGRHQAWLESNQEPFEVWLGEGFVGSVLEAQAAAQDDYERRIREALV